ncbi:MAG: ABC transporter permease [Elusimicrobia bacterium]|nr:ABC transporter permease [Elusimicrobiota bacterium]MDE2236871.1 ABC transporter permease [Elusimicrobiota bacterium]MDE2426539.1 ABC transporter permease [Elusimicrobiota bacterium]
MSLELFIALRYLRAKRKGLFAFVTTAIGVAGVTVGVAALITTLSVMNGFQTDIEKKVIGAQAELTVYGGGSSPQQAERLRREIGRTPGVTAVAPFILGQAIATYRDRTMGMVLKGLDPSREFAVNDLGKTLREGSWSGLSPLAGSKVPGIVLGEELARELGVWPGETIVLVSPKSMATPLGLLPKLQRFRVAGLLHTGYYEYDSTMGYCGLAAAARFLGVEAGASGFGARLASLSQADRVASRLRGRLGPGHPVRTYAQMNETLFAALKLEKTVMFIILTLIVLVASLNIASTLILRSVEKTRDIGLLKAMGATPRQIKRIFIAEGFLIGVSGLGMGLGLGLLLCWIIKTYPIVRLPADIYYLTNVPVAVEPLDVAAVMIIGLLLALLATVYPAARAAKVDPVEAIHYG